MNLQQKEPNLFMSEKKLICLTHFSIGEIFLDLYVIGFYQLASVTEAFYSDRNFCSWQKVFYCNKKLFSVTEVCFLERNLDRS